MTTRIEYKTGAENWSDDVISYTVDMLSEDKARLVFHGEYAFSAVRSFTTYDEGDTYEAWLLYHEGDEDKGKGWRCAQAIQFKMSGGLARRNRETWDSTDLFEGIERTGDEWHAAIAKIIANIL